MQKKCYKYFYIKNLKNIKKNLNGQRVKLSNISQISFLF